MAMHIYHCMIHTFYRFCLFILSPFCASDKPGNHDFEILRKLVLPDGSVLRAKYPGRPSRDCLFIDPVMDGKRYLDILTSKMKLNLHSFSNCLMPNAVLQSSEDLEHEQLYRCSWHFQLPRSRKLALHGQESHWGCSFRDLCVSFSIWCGVFGRGFWRFMDQRLCNLFLQDWYVMTPFLPVLYAYRKDNIRTNALNGNVQFLMLRPYINANRLCTPIVRGRVYECHLEGFRVRRLNHFSY